MKLNVDNIPLMNGKKGISFGEGRGENLWRLIEIYFFFNVATID